MRRSSHRCRLSRRHLLGRTALGVSALGLSGPIIPGPIGAVLAETPDKPAELIVRAWGGVWVEALAKGVSGPFSAATGIPVRHDLTEDNEIQTRIWEAVDQGRVPPVHVNWDTTTNAAESALRGVCQSLADLPNLEGLLPAAKPSGLEGWPLVNVYLYAYVLAYRDQAFQDGAPSSWNLLLDPKFKGRIGPLR